MNEIKEKAQSQFVNKSNKSTWYLATTCKGGLEGNI